MIEIDGKIVSTDILTEKFLCDLSACKGICCVDGNAGAPLELRIMTRHQAESNQVNLNCRGTKEGDEVNYKSGIEESEAEILAREWENYKPYMTAAGVAEIEKQGFSVTDEDGDLVTPLVGDAECAYSYTKDGVTLCAIEKAWAEGKTAFRKPVSCHLYPVRVMRFGDGSYGLNYHRWAVCSAARELGREKGVPVFRMLRDAIVRRFGEEFFGALEAAEKYLLENPA